MNPTIRTVENGWTFWRPASLRHETDEEVLSRVTFHPVAQTFLDAVDTRYCTVNGPFIQAYSLLGPLQDNGGPTPTTALDSWWKTAATSRPAGPATPTSSPRSSSPASSRNAADLTSSGAPGFSRGLLKETFQFILGRP